MKIHKNMTNLEIKDLLDSVAAAYQLQDAKANKFRIVAYQRAADAVEHMSSEAKDLWDDDKLTEVAGIGPSIAQHLDEIFKTGQSKHFEDVLKGLPPAIFELMKISGIGVKTAFKLVTKFDISAKQPFKDVQKLAEAGKIAKLEGFGPDSEKAILESVKTLTLSKSKQKRMLLPYAMEIADEVIAWLRQSKYVVRADALGSQRRRASTVGDIDIACAATDPAKALVHFTKFPKANRVLKVGDRSASIIIGGGRQIDLMAEHEDAYGALLQHFTGSKHHNVALREYALKKNLSVSDYGIYVKKDGTKKLKKFKDEEHFYNFLGVDWIPPELREGRGEIEAALKHNLPNLVDVKDIKADLQIHSDYDIETSHDVGQSTMADIVKKAESLRYEFIAFTEHNPSQKGHSDSKITEILKAKRDVVDQLNSSFVKLTSVKKVYNSLEIDMLPDGKLPVPDSGLDTLDFALVSIHSSFNLSRAKMTERVLRALAHPKVKIFAHPTGRKLTEREGVELDWEKIFNFCLDNNKWIEINADPMRLDLPDVLVHDAVKLGIKLTLGTDAHHAQMMDNMPWGVSVARRGWATKADIVNTLSQSEFEKLI